MCSKMVANVAYALEVDRFITVNMFQCLEIEVIQQPQVREGQVVGGS